MSGLAKIGFELQTSCTRGQCVDI